MLCTFFSNEKESTQTSVIGFIELSNQMFCKESHWYYLDRKVISGCIVLHM
jgi:hypothetical protein